MPKPDILDKHLKELAEEIGGEYNHAQKIHQKYKEKVYNINFVTYNNPNKGIVPAELSIHAKIKLKSGFLLFKESVLDKISKLVGLKTEYQAGYKDFDSKFLIKVDDEQFAAKVFSDSKLRTLIEELFSAGFTCLLCNDEIIEASKYPTNHYSDKNPELIRKGLHCLDGISKILTSKSLH
ncbi:MAG: hypothetical protein GY757_28980 [bacterium]|nr:hypothetical protein [bacterium]